MDKNEKIAHLRQLSKTVDSLIEAIENSNPVDDWNYTEEQLLEESENTDWRKVYRYCQHEYCKTSVIGEYDVK